MASLSSVMLDIRFIWPSFTKEMFPVSSDTTITVASVCSVRPVAALCRIPYCAGILGFSLIGNVHRAATMRLLAITMAPSCNGAFLKNIFSISLLFILASTTSPVSTIWSMDEVCANTISAPVLVSLILRQACVISSRVSNGISSCLLPKMSPMILRLSPPFIYLFPKWSRKRLISCWNNTIIAITPTPKICPRIAESKLMFKALTIIHATYIIIMPEKMLIAAVPLMSL